MIRRAMIDCKVGLKRALNPALTFCAPKRREKKCLRPFLVKQGNQPTNESGAFKNSGICMYIEYVYPCGPLLCVSLVEGLTTRSTLYNRSKGEQIEVNGGEC